MSKKEKQESCKRCGSTRLALGSIYGATVEPDQEPFVDGKIEPVIVNNLVCDEIEVEGLISCHVCVDCGLIADVFMESNGDE